MELEIIGKIRSSSTSLEFTGHQILLSYVTQKGNDASTRESGEISSEILSDGSFSLVLPDNVIGGIIIEVISPDREVLKSKFSKDQIDNNIVIDYDPKQYFPIPINNDPNLGKKLRITGIVLDEAGLQKISKKQVILYGFPKDKSDKEEVILVTTTDIEGYFAGDYPRDDNDVLQKFSKAYGVVAAGNPQKIPVNVDKDHLISRKVTLVISFPKEESVEEPRGKDECEPCSVTVPRLQPMLMIATNVGE